MLPPEEGWALFLLWVCAHIGGFTANKVNLPPLLGMLISGIILRNIPQGDAVELAVGCHRTVISTHFPTLRATCNTTYHVADSSRHTVLLAGTV